MSNTSLLGAYGALGNSSLLFRNKVINGDMRIDQRGATPTTGPSTGGNYSVDRWKTEHVNLTGNFTSVVTTEQYADHPINGANGFCARLQVSTADTVTNGTVESLGIDQRIEGLNCYDLYNKPLALSFWAKTSTPGTYGIQLRAKGTNDGLSDPNYFTTFQVSQANTWEKITKIIPAQNLSTIVANTGIGYNLRITLVSGFNENLPVTGGDIAACENQWSRYDGDGIASASLSNTWSSTVGNYFQLTDVQLEAGPVATPFEHRPYGLELQLCQRYYQQIYQSRYRPIGLFRGSGSTAEMNFMPFPVPMRAATTSTISSTGITYWTALNTSTRSTVSGSWTLQSNGSSWAIYTTGYTTNNAIVIMADYANDLVFKVEAEL